MSRIGKKPIPLPAGVKFDIVGSNVVVQGPKGKVTTHLPAGVKLQTADGNINVIRENEDRAAVHGLVRALVNNAVEGVTKGWTRDLEIMGIGYRAELKGKNMVVFTLGYSHPIEFPLPTGIAVTMMATYAVLQRAVENGQNLIITHEPTFFDDTHKAEPLPQGEQDPVLKEKLAFLVKHHLVICRFHDHWHRMLPDGI